MKKMKAIYLVAVLAVSALLLSSANAWAVSDEAQRHFDRGMAAVEMAKSPDDYAAAIKEFEQAIRFAPDWPDAYYKLGMAQEKAGKYTDAITSLKKYLRLAPNGSSAALVKSIINKLEFKAEQEITEAKRHFDRGMAAVEMAKSPDDYAAAIKEFEQAIKLAPDWPLPNYNLGLAQEKAENYSDAVISLRQYLKLAPNAQDAAEVKSIIARTEYKNEKLLKEKEKFQSVIGTWGLKETENEGFYESIVLTQNGEKIECEVNTAKGLETIEVFFDGTNMKFKYGVYDSFPREYEVIVKMVAPGRFKGIINQVILDTPRDDQEGIIRKGKTTFSLIMIKQ